MILKAVDAFEAQWLLTVKEAHGRAPANVGAFEIFHLWEVYSVLKEAALA